MLQMLGMFGMFRRMRRWIGGVMICFALIMAIPGILLFLGSSYFYGSPEVEPSISLQPVNGDQDTIVLNLISGNNYDIKLRISVSATPNRPANGQISINMVPNQVITGLPNTKNYADNGFNSTSFYETFELNDKNDFDQNVDITFTFSISGVSASVTSIEITLELYKNPQRMLSNILGLMGFFAIIPSVFLCCVGMMIAGTTEESSGSRTRRRR